VKKQIFELMFRHYIVKGDRSMVFSDIGMLP